MSDMPELDADGEHPYRVSLPVVSELDGKRVLVDTPGACPTCRWRHGEKEFGLCELRIRGLVYCSTINSLSDCEKWQPADLERRPRKEARTWPLPALILIDIIVHIIF